jgi:hypothetical protein
MSITYADFNAWMVDELHRNLMNIINAKQQLKKPYYVLAIIKKGYFGPPVRNNNEIIATSEQKREAEGRDRIQDMDLEGKKVISTRFVVTNDRPKIKMLGTACWQIDNRTGSVDMLWILPPDKPVTPEAEKDMDNDSELVHESGKGMPLGYSEN